MGISPKSEFYNYDLIGLPFLQGRATFGDRFPFYELYTSKWSREAFPGDILLSVRAPIGDLNITKDHIAIGRGLASIHPLKVTTDYLYYLLLMNKDKFLSVSSGGAIFDCINKDAIESVELVIHSREQQQHIVNIQRRYC